MIAKGKLLLVEEKAEMMKKLGKREMVLTLAEPMAAIPAELAEWNLTLEDEGKRLRYIFDARAERTGIPSLLRKLGDMDVGLQRSGNLQILAGGYLRRSGRGDTRMNLHGIWSIYRFEMARFRRTVWTSLMVPVITTTLYFVVFGTAIGSAMNQVSGVPYGAFIVPGLMLLSIFSESILNASLRHLHAQIHGTMYEILSAPCHRSRRCWAMSARRRASRW